MKHPVIVRTRKPKRFCYLGLGSRYKDPKDKGRRKILKDINDEEMEFQMTSPSIVFDISDEYENSIYTWLKNYPGIEQHLVFEDTIEQQMVATESMIESAEAIQIAVGMIGLQPSEFWQMSVIEIHLAIEGFTEFNGAEKEKPMTNEELENLMELYPD